MRALDGAKTLWAGPDIAARPYHPFTLASALPMTDGEIMDVWVEIFPIAAHIAADTRCGCRSSPRMLRT